MIKKYEDACREAGLSEERTREISRALEVGRSRFRRVKESQKKEGYYITSLYCEDASVEDNDRYYIDDVSPSLEETIIKKIELEQLREKMLLLGKEDRELLLAYYDPHTNFSQYVRSVGGDRYRMLRRKNRLVKILQELLKEWIEE